MSACVRSPVMVFTVIGHSAKGLKTRGAGGRFLSAQSVHRDRTICYGM
jgi:hypothetical protein